MLFGIVENGVVVNVAVADAPLGPNWIPADDPAIGDRLQDGKLVKVVPTDPPEADPTQVVVPDEPALIDGVWTQQWRVIDVEGEELLTVQTRIAKEQCVGENLPSWAAVEGAIDNIASLSDAKAFLKRLARVVYWDVKNQSK